MVMAEQPEEVSSESLYIVIAPALNEWFWGMNERTHTKHCTRILICGNAQQMLAVVMAATAA